MGQHSDPRCRQGGKATCSGRRQRRNGGFSLIMVSILLTAAALMMVAMLPGQEAGDSLQKSATTVERMMKIEQATTGFIAANGRRPCPADGQYDTGSHNFGLEAANPGSCTGGTPAAPLGPDAGTGNAVAGVVPTKTLGLPDEYAFDEWGRQISYVVDKRATAKASCLSLQNFPINNGKGGITIKGGGGAASDAVMAAYISHGPDGHGAFPPQGSTVAGRINAGSIDADTLVNAGVDSSFAYSPGNFSNVRVQKERTASFDDVVYYAGYQKNQCCIGDACIQYGLRIDGETGGYTNAGVSHGFGDLNGDGYPDLIVREKDSKKVYVIFGSSSGYPNPLPLSSLNGSNGFVLSLTYADNSQAYGAGGNATITTADINNDGIDDLIVGSPNLSYVFVLFGHANPWPATRDVQSSPLNGADGFAVHTSQYTCGGIMLGYGVAVGDFNGDGIKDLLIGQRCTSNEGYAAWVVFGHANPWGASRDVYASPLTGSDGFQLLSNGGIYYGWTVGAGDIDGDGIDDIFLGVASYQSMIVFGKHNWTTPIVVDSYVDGNTGFMVTTNGGYGMNYLYAADINGDGIKDLIVAQPYVNGHNRPVWVLFGHAKPWTHPRNLITSPPTGTDGTTITNPAVSGSLGNSLDFADVNGDGITDLLIGDIYPNSYAGKAYLLYGKSSWSASTDLSTLDGTTGTVFNGAAAGDYAGASVSIGDLDGDGHPDLVIGSYMASPNGVSNAGSSYVLWGKHANKWGAAFNLNRIP
jgi:hypothetical protein